MVTDGKSVSLVFDREKIVGGESAIPKELYDSVSLSMIPITIIVVRNLFILDLSVFGV